MIRNGRPACFRRMPARIPAMPQPITTTGDAALTSSGIWLPHATAPVSAPSNCRSSKKSPARRPPTGRQPRNDIISSRSSGDSSFGRQPPSRYARIAGRARRRTCACSSAGMPLWMSSDTATRGRTSPRTHAGSPVMCTKEHRSAGTLTSCSAAAISWSSSVKGSAAWGFRVILAPRGRSGRQRPTDRAGEVRRSSDEG